MLLHHTAHLLVAPMYAQGLPTAFPACAVCKQPAHAEQEDCWYIVIPVSEKGGSVDIPPLTAALAVLLNPPYFTFLIHKHCIGNQQALGKYLAEKYQLVMAHAVTAKG